MDKGRLRVKSLESAFEFQCKNLNSNVKTSKFEFQCQSIKRVKMPPNKPYCQNDNDDENDDNDDNDDNDCGGDRNDKETLAPDFSVLGL